VPDHRLQTRWSIDVERLIAIEHPWREHQISEPEGVIRVQVSDEGVRQPLRVERAGAGAGRRRRRPAHHTDAGVNEVRTFVNDDCEGRTEAIRIRDGSAAAEDHEF